MKINPDDYLSQLEHVHKQYQKNGISSLSLYAAVSGCPIYVCYYFALQIASGDDKIELEKRLKSIVEFYGYES